MECISWGELFSCPFGWHYGVTAQTRFLLGESESEYQFTLCRPAIDGLFICGLLTTARGKPLHHAQVDLGFSVRFFSICLLGWALLLANIDMWFSVKMVTKKKYPRARRIVGCHGIYFLIGILQDFFLPLGEKKESRDSSSFLDKDLESCMIYWLAGLQGLYSIAVSNCCHVWTTVSQNSSHPLPPVLAQHCYHS